MSAAKWVSVHAFHNGSLDALLVEAVSPAVERLITAGHAESWFFLRYWDGGPHLRVRMLVRPASKAVVLGELSEQLTEYLRAHPSPSTMSPQTYAELAAALAGREGVKSHETRLCPADSVAEIDYVPETEVYGTGVPLASVERHFAQSSRIARDALVAAPSSTKRRGLALSFGMLSLRQLEPDLDRLADTMRSARPAWPDGPASMGGPSADALAASYERQSGRLVEQAAALWRTSAEALPAMLRRWARSIDELHSALADGAILGELTVTAARSPNTWILPDRPAHQGVVASILMRCTHLVNNRLGVSLAEELHLNYLLARTVADCARPTQDAGRRAR